MRVGAAEPRGDRHAAGTWPVTLADIKGSSEREMISSLTFMSGNTGGFQPAAAPPPPPSKNTKHSRPQDEKIQRQLIVSEAARIITGSFSSSAQLRVAPGGRTQLGTRRGNQREAEWMIVERLLGVATSVPQIFSPTGKQVRRDVRTA